MAAAFHHVHIKAKDPRATVEWWVDMFGAEPLPEYEFGTMLFTPVELDGVKINITGHGPEEAKSMAEPQPIPYWGLEHVGIEVDDMDAILARFDEQGLKTHVRRRGPQPYEVAFVDAPDGLVLELLCSTSDSE